MLCKQGVAGSIPATSTNHLRPQINRLVIWPLTNVTEFGNFRERLIFHEDNQNRCDYSLGSRSVSSDLLSIPIFCRIAWKRGLDRRVSAIGSTFR